MSATCTSRPVRTPSAGGSAPWPDSSRTSSSTPATASPTRTPCPTSSTPSARCSTFPGAFVLGSNDYYAPSLEEPVPLPRLAGPATMRGGPPGTGDTPRPALARPRRRDERERLGRPQQRLDPALRRRPHGRAARRRRPAHPPRPVRLASPGPPDSDATSPSASCTRRTTGWSTGWPPTGSRSCSPGTPTAASSCIPGWGALVSNCDLARAAPRGCRGTRDDDLAARLGRARHVAVRARSASPARPRRPCSPSSRRPLKAHASPSVGRATGFGAPSGARGYASRARSGCSAAW